MQRFAHPHEHDIERSFERLVLADQRHLADDLTRAQVPLETHLAGEAEIAVERAPDLARQAQRDPVGLTHEHGLDRAAAGQLGAVLDGLVRGVRSRTEFAGIGARVLEQPRTQRLREVGPLAGRPRIALVKPAVHLVGMKTRDVITRELGRQAIAVQPVKVRCLRG